MIKYSIVIGTLNHCEDLLKPCIESILKYTDLSDKEIIVVANGCTDGTVEYVKSLGKSFVLLEFYEPLGYAKAYNEGIKVAKGEKIILLNNDVVLFPMEKDEWIKKLDNGADLSGPMTLNSPVNKEFLVFWCVMIKRKTINKIGLLDESFGVGSGEDMDFTFRVEQAGLKWKKCETFNVYHMAEGTVHDNVSIKRDEWENIYNNNMQKIRDMYGLPDGYFMPDDISEYRRLAEEIPDGGTLVELGVFKGKSLCTIADIIIKKKLNVYAVDTFEGSVTEKEMVDYCKTVDLKEIFTNNIKRFGIYDYVSVIKSDTHRYSELVKDKIDLVFIDADHTYEGCKQDIIDWLPKTKVIAGHDYGTWDGVTKSVNELLPKNNKVTCNGSVWSYKKLKKGEKIKPKVLAYILTRGRYQDYLPMAIMGVCNQSVLPDKLIIVDDNDSPLDLREHNVFQHLFHILDFKGIKWEVMFGPKKGQTYGHDLMNRYAVANGYEFCWRLDDDNFAESNVLETLLSVTDDTVGAVGGSVLVKELTTGGSGKIEEICSHNNLQWGIIKEVQEVDHLHCSFLYRAGSYQYNLGLEKCGHREETLFSYGIKVEGYRVLLVPCITWHFRPPNGGTRSDESDLAFKTNEDIFRGHLKYGKIFVLDMGLGDHIVFKKLIPDIKKKYKKFTLATCYPDVFEGAGLNQQISIGEAGYLLGNLDQYSPYHWATMNNYEGDILSLFRKFYLGL